MSDARFYIELGICFRCGVNPVFSKNECHNCLVTRRRYDRKRLGCKAWRKGGRGRPPLESRPQIGAV